MFFSDTYVMLPPLGYLSSVDCPNDKECTRPYCPFRHKTPFAAEESLKTSSISLDNVNDAIEKLKSDIYDRNASTSGIGDVQSIYSESYSPMINDAYSPEPYSNTYTNKKTVPQEYVPKKTKSVLQAARGATSYRPSKKTGGKKTKNIYASSIKLKPSTDMEYDPVINYSTSITKSSHKQGVNRKDTECKNRFSKRSHVGEAESPPVKKMKGESDDESDCDLKIVDTEEEGKDVVVVKEKKQKTISKLNSDLFGADSDSDIDPLKPRMKNKESLPNLVQTCYNDAVIQILSSDSELGNVITNENDSKEIETIEITSSEELNVLVNNSSTSQPHKDSKSSSGIKKKLKKVTKTPIKIKNEKSKLKNVSSKTAKAHQEKRSLKSQKPSKDESKPKKGEVKKPSIKREINPEDITYSDITAFVKKDEIMMLEKQLEGENTYEECLRIFQEGVEEPDSSEEQYASEKEDNSNENFACVEDMPSTSEIENVTGKRRVAHTKAGSSATSLRRDVSNRRRLLTPAQTMIKRMAIIEEERQNRLNNALSNATGRSAHKPTHAASSAYGLLTSAGRKISPSISEKKTDNVWYPNTKEPTTCGTATKGAARVAHQKSSDTKTVNGTGIPVPPRIAIDRYCKVPSNIRQRYLTTFIQECLRIFCNKHNEAYEMAKQEEEDCKQRSKTKNIYLSLAANKLKKLRDTTPKNTGEIGKSENIVKKQIPEILRVDTRKTPGLNLNQRKSVKEMSHNNMLDKNVRKCKGGYSIEKKEKSAELSAVDIYEKMCKYIMTVEDLNRNGYPRPGDVPGKARFECDPPLKPFNETPRKICVRCGKEFFLNKSGQFQKEEECTNHWGRAYMTRVGRSWEKRYNCCQERIGVDGCTISDTHVHAENKLDRRGYVKTLIKSPPHDGNCGVFALDCEMSYTTVGLELTRVSVLDVDCKLVYDTFVKPSGRVLDYNTRWSGITENDLRNERTTILDVQAVFLSKFSSDTILMGHSLESDFVALRLIHETVIDTAIVFPNKKGWPYKRALRTLSAEYLNVAIQNTQQGVGHDSSEDAAACMKLMMWKLLEDDKVSSNK